MYEHWFQKLCTNNGFSGRLLESFLAFRVPDKPGELFQKLETVNYDAVKKVRILRFLHTYSHFDQVAEPGHDPSLLSETPAILQDILALIRECDPEHFRCTTVVVDLFSRKVVEWSAKPTIGRNLVLEAVTKAIRC